MIYLGCEYLSASCIDCVFIMSHTRLEYTYTKKLPECQETPSTKQAQYLKISDCNGNRPHNYLVRKQTLNHLANLA